MGIEPTSEAWEACNKTLKALELAAVSIWEESFNRKLNGNRKGVADCGGFVL
jgi:hypothetical protein